MNFISASCNLFIQINESIFILSASAFREKKRKTDILFTISYIKNVAIMEINTINKNCPATPVGNFKAKKPATTKIGIWRM